MSLDSPIYFLFLPLVFLLFHATRQAQRWAVLLAASLVFYGALLQWYLLLALGVVAAVTYLAARAIAATSDEPRRKRLFLAALFADLMVLVALKYLPYFSENLNFLLVFFGSRFHLPPLPVLLSIGVSFYVFQALSYLSDVYCGIAEAESHFGIFFLYLSFFPKLLQGPVERAEALLPQLRSTPPLDYQAVRSGLFLFCWGLFQKVVVADRLALFVNAVYDDVRSFSGISLILATWLYAFQIYFDFAGYTDMAIGSARLFNIRLSPNFASPYLARSIADFWRRWHITISQCILDYLFKPLNFWFRRKKQHGTVLALLLAFLVSGIWHGPSWRYVAWGGLHGILLGASIYYKPWQKKIHALLKIQRGAILSCWQIAITFNLVCLGWIFFRAASFADAWYVVSHLFAVDGGAHLGKVWLMHSILLDQSWREAAVAGGGLLACAAVALAKGRGTKDLSGFLAGKPVAVRWALYYALLGVVLVFAMYDKGNFIYYQF